MMVVRAIDILDGMVVRVEQGDENRQKVYSQNPVDVAKGLAERGVFLIHVVDLNAAIHGDSDTNRDAIDRMLRELGNRVGFEVAGGIKDLANARSVLQRGARRIVIGSIAYSNLGEALSILKSLGSEKTVLALDYDSNGRVRTKGWKRAESEVVDSAVLRFSDLGYSIFLMTAIQKDGMLAGPDVETLSRIRKLKTSNPFKMIASGGVSTDDDLARLAKIGMDEAIVGKAIYEGKISSLKLRGN
ncbi:MAG: 1-(5-phosphoribosyl)-5-[(5-phosphoribosylamino)methylideneamino] imidazole-4-carboxamide isomerase [Nitrososphaerota archaeon]|nr:1-(5-phosphoribosyl)-5-[(5-phosphoribosylamino)methylideneamino] imidazole-4-carboxamide isomerase [Nitrososphaerota archaeon]